MAILQEFKQFALRGNVVDMAVGIVIGVAFGKVVSSLVSDITMPPIGKVTGGMDFSHLFVVLGGRECLSDIPVGAKRCKYCTATLTR